MYSVKFEVYRVEFRVLVGTAGGGGALGTSAMLLLAVVYVSVALAVSQWADHVRLPLWRGARDSRGRGEAGEPRDAALLARAAERGWKLMVAKSIQQAHLVAMSTCVPPAPSDGLVHAVEALGVRSVLDLGAGSLHWLPTALQRLGPVLQTDAESRGGGMAAPDWREGVEGGLMYHAVDAGGNALEELMPRELFAEGSVLRLTHEQLDVTQHLASLLPRSTGEEHQESAQAPEAPSPPDLVIARGLLQHLSLSDALEVYKTIVRSRAKYALLTSSPHASTNVDLFLLDADRYRPLNMLLPPFLPGQGAV